MSSWVPEKDEVVAERFLLLEEMARGGMGAVWRAQHVGLDVECAVKFIVTDRVNEEVRTRFRREARAAAKLKSRFVVNMLDYGLWNDQPYIAMELLEGESLGARLEREGALGIEETLDIVGNVARALAAAWSLGIVHRDLKPENIFLVEEDGETYPKVLDFGIAKVQEPAKLGANFNTDTGAILGTPWYMSPEQLDGTIELDVRSDLFALTVITYECLVGELPFDGEAFGNLMSKIMHGERPTPSEHMPVLPPTFDAWWHRAAHFDREERFATPKEWSSALRASFDMSPISSGTWDAVLSTASSRRGAPFDAAEMPEPVDVVTLRRRSDTETFGGQARASGKHVRSSTGATALVVLGALLAAGAGVWWFSNTTEGAVSTPAAKSTETAPTAVVVASGSAASGDPSADVAPAATPSAMASASATAPGSAVPPVTPRPGAATTAPAPRLPPKPTTLPAPKITPPPKPTSTGIAPEAPGF